MEHDRLPDMGIRAIRGLDRVVGTSGQPNGCDRLKFGKRDVCQDDGCKLRHCGHANRGKAVEYVQHSGRKR